MTNTPRPHDLRHDRDRRIADNVVPTHAERGGELPDDLAGALRECGADPKAFWRAIDGQRSVAEIVDAGREKHGEVDLRGVVRALRSAADRGSIALCYRRTFTTDDLLDGLRTLGIAEGDVLFVHSSLAAIGPVEGGAESVIDALQQAVGPQGTLVFPTFTFSIVERCPDEPYDPAATPSRVGALTEVFRKRPGVIRSRQPSHSVAAWGRHAGEIVRDNHLYGPCDIRGAFGAMVRLDATVVFLGTGFGPNTTLHAVEDWAELPSMTPATYHYIDEKGRRQEIEYDKCPFQHRAFYTAESSEAERMLREAGLVREAGVGLARTYAVPMRGMVEAAMDRLERGDVDFMYCDNPDCVECRENRRKIDGSSPFLCG
jgi:aminoglycoside 3-N-acetyltransferase